MQRAKLLLSLFFGYGLLLPLGVSHLACHKAPSQSDASVQPERCFQAEDGSPKITDFILKGPLPHQPYTLRFSIRWEDGNANLRGGRYQFTVDDVSGPILSLPESRIAAAPEGTFELTLPLPKDKVVPQKKILVELVLWDAEGLISNRPLLRLEVSEP